MKKGTGNGGYGLMIQRNSNLKKMPPQKESCFRKSGFRFFSFFEQHEKISETFAGGLLFLPIFLLLFLLFLLWFRLLGSWLLCLCLLQVAKVSIHKNSQFIQKLQLAKIAGFFKKHMGLSLSVNDSREVTIEKVIPPFLQCDKP